MSRKSRPCNVERRSVGGGVFRRGTSPGRFSSILCISRLGLAAKAHGAHANPSGTSRRLLSTGEPRDHRSRPPVVTFASEPNVQSRIDLISVIAFPFCKKDPIRCRFWKLGASKLANEALHRLIATRKAVVGHQVLPDSLASTSEALLDQLPVRFTGTCRWRRRVTRKQRPVFLRKGLQSRGSPWPVLTDRGRWSPRRPVLPALGVPTQAGIPPPRLTLGKHLLFLFGHQWLARCAVKAIRASPVR
jgi:hypothetical protein